jgi:dsRNA-specific ribonuclease
MLRTLKLTTSQARLYTTATTAASKPTDTAALAAFTARTRISLPLPVLIDALTHKSHAAATEVSERYHMLGGMAASLYSLEYVMALYPQMPATVAKSIAEAYMGQISLARVGQAWGLNYVLRSKVFDADIGFLN